MRGLGTNLRVERYGAAAALRLRPTRFADSRASASATPTALRRRRDRLLSRRAGRLRLLVALEEATTQTMAGLVVQPPPNYVGHGP
jgi:hypothetical protein